MLFLLDFLFGIFWKQQHFTTIFHYLQAQNHTMLCEDIGEKLVKFTNFDKKAI